MLHTFGVGLCNVVSTASKPPVFLHPYLHCIVKKPFNILREEGRLTNVAKMLTSEFHAGHVMSKLRDAKSL
jgi:hypothetical protein